MKVQDMMRSDMMCGEPGMTLKEAAEMMMKNQCGCLPIIEGNGSGKLVGVVTDFDMVTKCVAMGMDCEKEMIKNCMSMEPVMIMADADMDTCCEMMEEKEVRRMPVCDSDMNCIGMIAMADMAPSMDQMPMMKNLMQTVSYV
jgi:CBS domain-containing protein